MTKVCTKCKEEKSITEFHKWASTKDGYQYNCKKCKAAYRKKNGQLPHNLQRTKAYHFKWKYGITPDEYNDLWEKQDGVCAICHKAETHIGRSGQTIPLSVDHDHKTGKVRGLLCNACNVSLGGFRDNIINLQNAINYLYLSGGGNN